MHLAGYFPADRIDTWMLRNNMLLHNSFDSCGSGTFQNGSKSNNTGIVMNFIKY